MNLVKATWERLGLQKPAGKAALVVIIILAQCCVCILPFTVMSLSSGEEMVKSSPAAAAEAGGLSSETYAAGTDLRPGLYQGIEGMLERGFESARQMVAASLPRP